MFAFVHSRDLFRLPVDHDHHGWLLNMYHLSIKLHLLLVLHFTDVVDDCYIGHGCFPVDNTDNTDIQSVQFGFNEIEKMQLFCTNRIKFCLFIFKNI